MFLTQNVEIFMKCKLYLSSGVESNLIGAIISDQINQLLTSARHQQPSITTFQHSQATQPQFFFFLVAINLSSLQRGELQANKSYLELSRAN